MILPRLKLPAKHSTYQEKYMASPLDGFTFDDIEYLIETNPYLRGYLSGYLAELSLQRQLEGLPNISSVRKIPDAEQRKGDLEVVYKGLPLTIECKSIESSSIKVDHLHNSWTGSVSIKNSDKRTIMVSGEEVSLTNLVKGTFDILAISCFAVNGTWSFLFIENKYLPEKNLTPGLISTKLLINPKTTACVQEDISLVLEKAYQNKHANPC